MNIVIAGHFDFPRSDAFASGGSATASRIRHIATGLAEAMCVGVPCVASTTGGIPSMIKDGYNGLLFETGNIEQLAEKVTRFLSDEQLVKKLGANIRSTAMEHHNPAKVAQETLDAYNVVLVVCHR